MPAARHPRHPLRAAAFRRWPGAFSSRRGTLPPSRRASDSPMATACLRLFTLRPEPPLRRFPSFISRIAAPTFSDALLPYFFLAFFFAIDCSILRIVDDACARKRHPARGAIGQPAHSRSSDSYRRLRASLIPYGTCVTVARLQLVYGLGNKGFRQ